MVVQTSFFFFKKNLLFTVNYLVNNFFDNFDDRKNFLIATKKSHEFKNMVFKYLYSNIPKIRI